MAATLCALSTAATRAASVSEAAEAVLQAAQHSGLIRAGAIEIIGADQARHEVGETALLPADLSAAPFPPAAPGSGAITEPLSCRSPVTGSVCFVSCEAWGGVLARMAAEQVAAVIDRVGLEEQTAALRAETQQRIGEVSTIYEVGRLVHHSDTGRLMRVITEKAARAMGAQACSLMRLDPDTGSLYVAASHGLPADIVVAARRAVGEGIAGQVAASGEPLLITRHCTDARLAEVRLRPDVGSSVIVPMSDENGRVMGVLCIRRQAGTPEFTQDDVRLLAVFATHAALAISNARLYNDLRRRVRELSTVSELTQAVISHLDLQRLLDSVADSIVDVVKLSRCCIYLYDKRTNRFVPRIVRGYERAQVCRNPVRHGEGVVGIVARKQMPIVVTDARTTLQPMRGFARSLATTSFVAVPVMSRGQAIGVVVADNQLANQRVQAHSVELLTTFVNQAGIAIENAQLYEDREQRYQEMNRLAAQTDNILRSIAATVVVVDHEERITRWNQAAEEFTGLRETAVLGHTFSWMLAEVGLPAAEASRLERQMRDALRTGTPYQGYQVTMHLRARGSVSTNILLSPVIDRQGAQQGAVLVLEDVTRAIALEREMERMRRLADIGQLAAKIAHEVRNPLSSIKGAAQLIDAQHRDPARLHEFMGIIIDEVNSLNRLTTDLLTFARPVRLGLKPTNLNDLVRRTLRLLENQDAKQGIEVRVALAPDLPDIVADPDQLQQVLRNVFLNAAQAMPEGGVLAIATQHSPGSGSVALTCEDTGVGIPADKLEDVFLPFYTTKARGTGLGLSIVRRIVELHGGAVSVESVAGHGTSFRIELLLVPPERAAGEPTQLTVMGVATAPLPDE